MKLNKSANKQTKKPSQSVLDVYSLTMTLPFNKSFYMRISDHLI